MNTMQINKIMSTDRFTRTIYIGTIPIDKLPKKVSYPSCLIINNQPSNEPGEHWIAVYYDRYKNAEFFDSFGQDAKNYKLNKFLISTSKYCKVFNDKQLQSNFSSYCGYYCVLFLLFKARGYSMKKFVSLFKNPYKNDKLLQKLIKTF